MLPRRLGVARTVVIGAMMAASLATSASALPSTLGGRWEGAVQIPGSPVVIVLDLEQSAAGVWVGSAIFPGFGVKGAPLKDLAAQDSEFSGSVKSAMGEPKLIARLTADGTLSGSYEQAGHRLPMSLKRAGVAQVDLPKQSTAIRKELEGGWESLLDLGAFKMRLGLKLANGGQGWAEGQLIMIDSGNSAAPVDLISQTGDKLELSIAAVNFGYEGLISRSNDELKGILRVGSLEFPLIWLRAK